MPEVR